MSSQFQRPDPSSKALTTCAGGFCRLTGFRHFQRLAVVLALTLVASSAIALQGSSALDLPALSEAAEVGDGAKQPCLDVLAGSVSCGRFRVAESRSGRPQARTLDLAFVLLHALEPEERHDDAVAFLLGGPGSSPVARARQIAGAFSRLRSTRDLLLVDFRGVGFSGSLDCSSDENARMETRFEELIPLEHVRSCADRLGSRADLAAYTSNSAIDDMEALRQWLGLGPLNLYAASYGVREAQVYVRRHPKSVRTLSLDAASSIATPIYLHQARHLERALDLLEAPCAGCPAPDKALSRNLKLAAEAVRAQPPSAIVDGQTVTITPAVLGYAVRGLLYGRVRVLADILEDAVSGSWEPLASYYLRRVAWLYDEGGNAGYHLSVVCAEDVSRVTDKDVGQMTASTFLGASLIEAYRGACEVWPHAQLEEDFFRPVVSEVPALVLNGGRDPATPPSSGQALSADLPNSVHVVFPGRSHGAFSPCALSMVSKLIDSGTTSGIDTACAQPEPGKAKD